MFSLYHFLLLQEFAIVTEHQHMDIWRHSIQDPAKLDISHRLASDYGAEGDNNFFNSGKTEVTGP